MLTYHHHPTTQLQASVAVLSIDANEDMDKEFGTLVAQEYVRHLHHSLPPPPSHTHTHCLNTLLQDHPGRKALARDHAFIAMCMHIKKIVLLVFNVRKGKLDKVQAPLAPSPASHYSLLTSSFAPSRWPSRSLRSLARWATQHLWQSSMWTAAPAKASCLDHRWRPIACWKCSMA